MLEFRHLIHVSFMGLLILLFLSCKKEDPNIVKTPEWSKGAVWYQIFPERFRNGDTNNDPTEHEVMGDQKIGWEITPWTSGWYTRANWEKKLGPGFYDSVFDRRYGGDLQGVIEKLDYIAGLGVTALYFNPVFEAHSLHKYDASSYHHIDNNFGRNSQGDMQLMENEVKHTNNWAWTSADSVFLELISEAHKRGIRVVIDGVFNHVGRNFWAFQDVLKNGPQSVYKDWFIIKQWDDPATPENEFDYSAWWGFRSLPEFREDDDGIVREVKDHIWAITKRWMDPNNDGDPSDGIDGWRLDVVPDVSKAFWRDWCSYTRTINPDVYLAAEIWEEAQDYMGNDMFNAVMNYPFAFATVNFFIDTNKQITPTEFGDRLSKLLKIYSWDVTLSVMTLTSSHDTDRLANMIKNPDRQYDRKAGPRDSLDYNVTKPTADEQKIQVMIAALQATFPGAPMIYYGDEAGIWGADDPDDRKPMIWEDLNYEDENYSSLGKDYPADKVFFDKDLFKKYQTLFNTRKNYKALQHGDFKIEIMDDTRELFGFSRTYQNETIYIYFNRSHAPHSIPVKSEYNDLLGNQIEKDETGFKLILAAQTASILIPN